MNQLNPSMLNQAREAAILFHHKYIRAEHLLLAILRDNQSAASRLLNVYGVDDIAVQQQVSALACPVCSAEETLELAEGAKRAVQRAGILAGDGLIGSEHMLLGVIEQSIVVRGLLERLNVDLAALRAMIQSPRREQH